MDTLRWIHLSDIHFKGSDQYETKRMRDCLLDELKKISREKKIDMIFITGDLAYQGQGYNNNLKKFINDLLSTTSVENENLFIIPGNHDLKRNQTRQFIIEGTRKASHNLESDTLQTLVKGFSQYSTFYKKVKGEECSCLYEVLNRDNVNIILMNTALTAGTNEDDGNLIIEKNGFYNTIKSLKDKENCINIVLGHHPITSFMGDEQKIIINNFIDYNVDFYFCGHMHKGGYAYDLTGQRIFPSYQCGSGMVDDYATVTFLMGELDIENKKGTLIYYKWYQKEECWAKGGSDGRRAITGEIELVLDRFKENVIETFEEIDINEDEFRRFMMEFHKILSSRSVKDVNLEPKDVFDKFNNMKCNKSVEKQYHSLCRYFQVVNEIMESSLLSQIEKESIPNIVISEYNKLLGTSSNGNEIIEGIVQSIFKEYAGGMKYSNTTLKTYFKILVYWSIYECDIFNDKL